MKYVSHGYLEGATGFDDWFLFFCPKCADRKVMQILDHHTRRQAPHRGLVHTFKLHCKTCKLDHAVTIEDIPQPDPDSVFRVGHKISLSDFAYVRPNRFEVLMV